MTTDTSGRTNPTFPIGFKPLEGTSEDCENCGKGVRLDFGFEYAYQPIVDVSQRTIYAHEALVRGPQGEGALTVLSQVNDSNRYRSTKPAASKPSKALAPWA